MKYKLWRTTRPEIITLSQGKKVVGCRWGYKIKYKADGEVERFKAILVAKSYSPKEGLDYQETFFLLFTMGIVRAVT